ncbi:type II toxin-antitoxin system RelE/ParE family toxin [Qipengyuania sp. DSG2-2]|uniref:type II toxin-antitoxin system RelE/ParE family toxin n=1 Tax=Qipengyuania sp. DGS2-2 TaxID=3349631 RepID=UPI0036D34312
MEIESIRNKALRRFVETGKPKGVIEPARLARIIEFLDLARSFDELYDPPNFGFHPLTADRAGSYAITVTRNWRLTFTKVDDHTIADLDLEDYH